MSYLINNQQKMNEIIFAGRNKNYGAYAIRSSYGNTLLKSLMLVMAGSVSIMLTAYYLCRTDEAVKLDGQIKPNTRIYTNTIVDITPKKEEAGEKSKDLPAKPDKPSPDQKKNGVATVIDSKADSTTVETTSAVTTSTAGIVSASVATTGDGSDDDSNRKPGGGNNKKGEDDVQQLYGVDTQPEFEGGMAALYRFVSNNLRYPSAAADVGKEGTVYVKFVVDENGKVGSLSLQSKKGYGLDEEALRVIGMIPKFKTPAKLDGVPVKVYYQLPIRFKLR